MSYFSSTTQRKTLANFFLPFWTELPESIHGGSKFPRKIFRRIILLLGGIVHFDCRLGTILEEIRANEEKLSNYGNNKNVTTKMCGSRALSKDQIKREKQK